MVYKENMVVAVKCNGSILRERDNCVFMPFGSEYIILIKNLEARKSVVSVSIDGEDVLDGDRLIANSNSSIELQGFKKGNRVTNKFKFIEKTAKISDHRGDRIDDGIIRVEYTFEERYKPVYRFNPTYWYTETKYNTTDPFSVPNNAWILDSFSVNSRSPDVGITTKGSTDVHQSFEHGFTGTLENNSTVITLRLCGTDVAPVTIRTKLECSCCGTKNRSNHRYCSECGTCLEVT